MTETTETIELTEFGNIEKSLRAGVSVAIHAKQTLEVLDAKVDTLGVATVDNIKKNKELVDLATENRDHMSNLVSSQYVLTSKAIDNGEKLDNLLSQQSQEAERIRSVADQQTQLSEAIDTTFDTLKGLVNQSYQHQNEQVHIVETQMTELADLAQTLDYSKELADVNQQVSVLGRQIDALHQINVEKCQDMSDKLDKLELVVSTLMESAQLYQENQNELSGQIQSFNGQLDRIEENVRQLRVRPALVAQDAIMNLFNSWEAQLEPEVEETPVEEENVQEDIQVQTPIVEEKKGFFHRLLKK
jgi:hypothetical protein